MITTKETKEYIVRAVKNATSDNLERANLSFRNLPDSELDKEHGQSGMTRREIWDGYKNERLLNESALSLINEKL